ncbi:hypothetical protein JD969_09015 [Planctomycetota bacterium]|nr:hypothetical protein JD969_09015 [Planctomycetota bacterium]
MRYTLLLLLLSLFILFNLYGCEFKGKEISNDSQNNLVTSKAWQPKPIALRIYPSTRFVVKDKTQILEARVELFDEMGDSIKGSGIYAFELLEAVGPTSGGAGSKLYAWNIDLTTLQAQEKYYDPIARSYFFPLEMHESKVAQQGGVLHVVYTPVVGRRLDTQQPILP